VRGTLRLITVLFVLICCVGCDQAAKGVVKDNLAAQPPVFLLNGVVTLQYAENSGAFLSLGAGLPAPARTVLLVFFAGALVAGALVYVLRSSSLTLLQCVALSLVAGGGLGNLIDRLLHNGRVVDFVVLSAGPLHTGIFNLADVALVAGLILFGLSAARPNPPRHAVI
jgi:signal peptidase II